MMEMTKFIYEGNKVRTVTIDGKIHFVGKDVAEILGYSNTRAAILNNVDHKDRFVLQKSTELTFAVPTRGLTIINESGLYSLILGSTKPEAKKFKHWITSEVLPALEESGEYSVEHRGPTPMITKEDILKMIRDDQEIRKTLTEYWGLQEKPVAYDPATLLTTSQISKEFHVNAQDFNNILFNLGIQYKDGKTWVLTPELQDKGYAVTAEFTVNAQGLKERFTKWTPEGKVFLIKELKAHGLVRYEDRSRSFTLDEKPKFISVTENLLSYEGE